MSRTIKDSLDLLEQSLTDCKTALTEKGVTDVEAIKISDVNEKIAEIQAGGSGSSISEFTLKNVTFSGDDIIEFNQQQKIYSSETTGNLVINYEYTGGNFEAKFILFDVTSNSIKEEWISYGTKSATFNSVSSASDSGNVYILIVYKVYEPKSEVVFSVNLYNYSSDY